MEEDSLADSPIPLEAGPEVKKMLVTGEPPSAAGEGQTVEEPEAQSQPVPPVALSLLEVLMVSVVLEDTADQLSILGHIMPWPQDGRQSTAPRNNGPDKLPTLLTSRKILTPLGPTLPEVKLGGQLAMEVNEMPDLAIKTPTGQAIMTMDSLKKIQSDRQFFSDVIVSTMQEMQESGTFTSLLQALCKEREHRMHFYEVIAREEKGRKMIKSLQKQLINVKKERQAEVQNGNEYIAHLKDQLQEMKAKTSLENYYMKRNTELQIAQTQKKCSRTEEVLLEEIEKLQMKTEEENRIHMEIEMFLRKEQQRLEEKLEFWMEKFDKDTEMKQNELNALKSAKASDLAHLQDLAKTIREYEQVIIEDRIEKEKTRKKMQQDMLELKSAIKIQAWWRGTVIQKEIGGFKMPKKEKEDSKDSKGKGKDKRRGKK